MPTYSVNGYKQAISLKARTTDGYEHKNWYLLRSFELHVLDATHEHRVQIKELGFDEQDVLEWGSINRHGPRARTSPAVDRGEICAGEHLAMLRAVEWTLNCRRTSRF